MNPHGIVRALVAAMCASVLTVQAMEHSHKRTRDSEATESSSYQEAKLELDQVRIKRGVVAVGIKRSHSPQTAAEGAAQKSPTPSSETEYTPSSKMEYLYPNGPLVQKMSDDDTSRRYAQDCNQNTCFFPCGH